MCENFRARQPAFPWLDRWDAEGCGGAGERDDDEQSGAVKPRKKRIQRRLSDPGGGGMTELTRLAAARVHRIDAYSSKNNKPDDGPDPGAERSRSLVPALRLRV